MRITSEMLQASTQKAIDLGVLPRISFIEDLATNTEIMMEILEAALNAIEEKASASEPESHRR